MACLPGLQLPLVGACPAHGLSLYGERQGMDSWPQVLQGPRRARALCSRSLGGSHICSGALPGSQWCQDPGGWSPPPRLVLPSLWVLCSFFTASIRGRRHGVLPAGTEQALEGGEGGRAGW